MFSVFDIFCENVYVVVAMMTQMDVFLASVSQHVHPFTNVSFFSMPTWYPFIL